MAQSTSNTYISPDFADILAHNQLDTFNTVWEKSIEWFEEPNQRRGGWSGVGRICLQNAGNNTQVFYLKKQLNHGRRTWRHPIVGEPTFRREFEHLQLLAANHFAAPQVAFYAESTDKKTRYAVLMTAELTDYKDLAEIAINELPVASYRQKQQLIKEIANEIKRFHNLGLMHRALYPKHIFVKNALTQPEIALIDLEKVRKNGDADERAVFDLSALNRHSEGFSHTQRLVFLNHYLQQTKLDIHSERLAYKILKRSNRD